MNTMNTMHEVHLPELSGSEKQIKWANDIRESLLLAADANVRNAERNVELMISPSTTNIPSVAGAEWARETAVKELMSVTKASDIIDARDRLTQDTLERMGKYYDSQLAKATTEEPTAEETPAEEPTTEEPTTEETAGDDPEGTLYDVITPLDDLGIHTDYTYKTALQWARYFRGPKDVYILARRPDGSTRRIVDFT